MAWVQVARPTVGSYIYVVWRPYGGEGAGEVLSVDDHTLSFHDSYKDRVTTLDLEDVTHVWEWMNWKKSR